MGLFSTSVEAPDYSKAMGFVQQGMTGAVGHTQAAGDFEKQWLQQALQLQERQFGIQQKSLNDWQEVSRQDTLPYVNAGYDAMDALMGTLGLPTWTAGTYNVMNAVEAQRRVEAAKSQNRKVDQQLASANALFPDWYYTDINPDGTIRSMTNPQDTASAVKGISPAYNILSPENRSYFGPQYGGPNGFVSPYNSNQYGAGQYPAANTFGMGTGAPGGATGSGAGGFSGILAALSGQGPGGGAVSPQGVPYNNVTGYTLSGYPGSPAGATYPNAYNPNLPLGNIVDSSTPGNRTRGTARPGIDFQLIPGYTARGDGSLEKLGPNAQVGGLNWNDPKQKTTLWDSFMNDAPSIIATGYDNGGHKVSDEARSLISQLLQNLSDVGPYKNYTELKPEQKALVDQFMGGTLERSTQAPAVALQKFFNTPAYQLQYGSTGAAVDPNATPLQRFQVSPSYEFDVDQQLQKLERQASVKGLMGSTALAQYMSDYVHGKANSEYNNYQSNIQNLFGNYQQQLASVAGMGANASQGQSQQAAAFGPQVAGNNMQNTMNIANTLGGIGTALGNSELGQANVIQNQYNQMASLAAAQAEADAAAKNASQSGGGGIGNILGSLGGKIAGAATNYALGQFFG